MTISESGGTFTFNATDTNTDTKVTSVGNHYTPTADSASALSVDASSTTSATWGTTDVVTGVNIARDAKGHVTGLTVDSIQMPSDRLFTTLVPTGTQITSSSTSQANLNTTTYLKVGRYFCSQNAQAKTIKNCPVSNAFMMEVYSPLSTTIDNETTATYVYRLRRLTEYNTGIQYIQYVGSGATAGSFTYNDWYAVPRAKLTLDTTDLNDGNVTTGSATKPVYVAADGTMTACTYSLEKSVPSNAVFTDTLYTHPAGGAPSKTSGLYKFATDATSHIKSVTAVTKADITALGIPGSDTNTTYSLSSPASKANGSVTLNLDASSGTDTSVSIKGSGATTVTTDANGVITISSTDTNTNTTYSGGNAITIGTDNKINHADTSTQASVSANGRKYVTGVTLDGYGHVTGLTTGTETVTDTNTTYSLSGALSGNTFVSTLTAGGSGSGTTTSTVPAMTAATASAAGKAGLVPAPGSGKNTSFLRGDGTWVVPTNTKNTAGSTDSSSKLFLIGATSQAANPQTYSHDTAYVGTNGHLYSNSKQVVNLSDTQALTNKTYNGYTLGAACAKGVDTTVTSGSTNLVTSGAVYSVVGDIEAVLDAILGV